MYFIFIIVVTILFICLSLAAFLLRPVLDPQRKKSLVELISDSAIIWWAFAKVYVKQKFYRNHHHHHGHFKKNVLQFPYKYNDKTYYHLEKVPRFCLGFQTILDEEGNDVSESVLPYLPINLKTQKVDLYPRDFGYKKLIFRNHDNIESVFEENEIIQL